MKKKLIIIILSIINISIISFLIFSTNKILYYKDINKTIDKKIMIEKRKMKEKQDALNTISNANEKKEKNLDNMDEYIKDIKEKIKEYE